MGKGFANSKEQGILGVAEDQLAIFAQRVPQLGDIKDNLTADTNKQYRYMLQQIIHAPIDDTSHIPAQFNHLKENV